MKDAQKSLEDRGEEFLITQQNKKEINVTGIQGENLQDTVYKELFKR